MFMNCCRSSKIFLARSNFWIGWMSNATSSTNVRKISWNISKNWRKGVMVDAKEHQLSVKKLLTCQNLTVIVFRWNHRLGNQLKKYSAKPPPRKNANTTRFVLTNKRIVKDVYVDIWNTEVSLMTTLRKNCRIRDKSFWIIFQIMTRICNAQTTN